MNLALLAAAPGAHALIHLLIVVIVAIVVIAAVYWLASQVLPPPYPNFIVGLLGLILLIWVLLWLADSA